MEGSVEVTVIINHSQAFCLYGVRRRGLGWAPSREGGPIECKEFCWWQEMGRTFRILRGIVMVWGITLVWRKCAVPGSWICAPEQHSGNKLVHPHVEFP